MTSLRDRVWKDAMRAIIVPGHAVYAGTDESHARRSASWLGTFPGYRADDEARCYAEHVEAGVIAAAASAGALLVFSGGQTREAAGPRSEGQSYWLVADQCSWFGKSIVKQVALAEEFARDSFENLLFGIYRFWQCTGRNPAEVAVCGFAFKSERYHFHADTILGCPDLGCGNFTFDYVPVNDPPHYVLEGPKGSREGEAATLDAFRKCPLGNNGELLAKRLARDPFLRGVPYRPAAQQGDAADDASRRR